MPLPLIVAHRGFSSRHRENSPAAWKAAMDAGADYIEVDLRVTADGAIVCCHDSDLKRLTGRDVAIASIDAASLAAIEAEGFPAAPPIGLLFETVPADRPILFDVKDESVRALDLLLAALAPLPHRAIALGLHAPRSVGHVRAGAWRRPLVGLVATGDEEAFFSAGGDIVRIWEWDTAPGRIESHVARGRPVWITTGEGQTGRKVGDFDAAGLERMARAGASGFLVNDPQAAKAALESALA